MRLGKERFFPDRTNDELKPQVVHLPEPSRIDWNVIQPYGCMNKAFASTGR
jgi:hypothetical protein